MRYGSSTQRSRQGRNERESMSENTEQTSTNTTNADPPKGAPAGTPTTEQMLQMTSEQLKERLTRAQMSFMHEQFGTKDPAEIKAKLQQLVEMEQAEEKRKREQLTREQQLQADLEAQRAVAAKAQEDRDAMAFETHITRLCAEIGVKNVDYAMWEVARQTEALKAGEQLDAKAHLTKLLESDQSRAALGAVAPVSVEQVPVNTDPTGGQVPPTELPQVPKGQDSFGMNAADWAAKKARLGIQ